MTRDLMIGELKKIKPSYNYDRYDDRQIFRMYQRYIVDKTPRGDVVTQQPSPEPGITPTEKSIEDYAQEYDDQMGYKTCDNCGTRLNDMGTCPKCDEGEEDLIEDITRGYRVDVGSNKMEQIIASREFESYDEAKAFIDEITPDHSGTNTPVDYAIIYSPNGSCVFGVHFLKAWQTPESTDEPIQCIKSKTSEGQKRYPLWLYQKLEDAVAKIDDIPDNHKEEFITLVGDRATAKRIPGIGYKASLLPKACVFAKENGLPCKDYNSLIAHPEYYGTTIEDALRTIYNTMKKRWFKDTSLYEGIRIDNDNEPFNIGSRVAERWDDGEFNVGSIINIKKDENGTQYLVQWDYSDLNNMQWLYGDELTHWLDDIEENFTIDDEYTNSTTEDKICVICGATIERYGNNADPIADGICCDKCNREKVIPARIKMLLNNN